MSVSCFLHSFPHPRLHLVSGRNNPHRSQRQKTRHTSEQIIESFLNFFFTSIETHPVPYCTMYFDFYDILYLFVMNGGKMYHKTKACIVLKWNTVYIFYSTVHYSNYRASCIVFLEFVFNWSFSLVFIHMDHEGKTHNWLKKLYIQYTS